MMKKVPTTGISVVETMQEKTVDLSRFLEEAFLFEFNVKQIRQMFNNYNLRYYTLKSAFPIYKKKCPGAETCDDTTINSLSEAQAYLAHPVLGNYFREVCLAWLDMGVKRRNTLLFFASDEKKRIVASLTLFDLAEPNGLPALMLRIINKGQRDMEVCRQLHAENVSEQVPPVSFSQLGLPQPVFIPQECEKETYHLYMEALLEYCEKKQINSLDQLKDAHSRMTSAFERSYRDIALAIVNYCLKSEPMAFPTVDFVVAKSGQCRPFCQYMLNTCQIQLTARIKKALSSGKVDVNDILYNEVESRVVTGYKKEVINYVDDSHYNGCGSLVSTREVETPVYKTIVKRECILEPNQFLCISDECATAIELYWYDLVDEHGVLDINRLSC